MEIFAILGAFALAKVGVDMVTSVCGSTKYDRRRFKNQMLEDEHEEERRYYEKR